LASAGSDMDQSSTRTKRTSVGYLGKGRLMGGRGVIFPGSYRNRYPPDANRPTLDARRAEVRLN